MLMLALMLAAVSGQERPYGGPSETYAPSVVRPFEPPSAFGRQVAEGDADPALSRRALTAPVVVEAYRHSYETDRSDGEISYDQGVAQARINQDSRMGPLDGDWSVVGADGRPMLDIVLSDRGPARPVEGAWSRQVGRTAARDLGPIDSVVRDDAGVVIEASVENRPIRLQLRREADGWSGVMTAAGRDQPVRMVRPG